MKNKRFLQCSTKVNKENVRRESIDGVEHIIVSSHTLPDNIVMNGGLYPAEEIASSFDSLERTLAPVEHPTDAAGNFISANDPLAIHNFHAGAFNSNVRRENGRVHIDKVINVQEAMKTDRGKRLLDRVAEIETSDDPRPIHTSVGVFLMVEELDQPKTNAQGLQYEWVASEMVFDHDAILLDSVGAAQPHQGVGMAVNAEGQEIAVDRFELSAEEDTVEGVSHNDIREALSKALNANPLAGFIFVIEVFEDKVIFESEDQLFSVPYLMSGTLAQIVGVPLPVERETAYVPQTNSEGNKAMKELILNALKLANVETEGKSDADLFKAFQELNANHSEDDNSTDNINGDIADVVANAVKEALLPVTDELEGLKAKLNEQDVSEKDALVEIVANSDKYAAIDAETAKLLPVDKLKEMAANCGGSFGLSNVHANLQDDSSSVDMPE